MINSAVLRHDALKNKLFSALPANDFERLQPHLEFVALAVDTVVYQPDQLMEYVYFPTTSLISMLYTTIEGVTTEIGIHGSDGVVGLAVFLDGVSMPHQAVVMVAGHAYRIKAEIVREEFTRNICFRSLLLRFTLALITQISQTAVCNRLHSVEQHLCRWLLHSQDRLQSDRFTVTQEVIAKMLGVRREGVSVAAGRLQDKGLIVYSRGTVKILDRRGLEDNACECYQVAVTEYSKLIG